MTNFRVDTERIENMYEALYYSHPDEDPVFILRQINEKLLEEQHETPASAPQKASANRTQINTGAPSSSKPNNQNTVS